MALAAGTHIGAYEIVAALGAGGMGEVYRARDTKLNREVALKVLPAAFTGDPDRLARFKREAHVLASLNHPNIGAIYGFEDSDGVTGLVLELVEGPTLADRIARGAIPIAEALAIATQIADALEAAHEQGIIHRDLKPANIKLRPDGTVKVLDFGLAKALGTGVPSVGLSQAATVTSPAMTRVGVVLGTAAYMSAEQARGEAAGKRSDVWAFGCVLYEMLAGRPAFPGDSVTEVLARVLEREPDWRQLPPTVPSRVEELLRRCLEKDPKKRRRDIGDVRLELDEARSDRSAMVAPPAGSRSSRRGVERVVWALALLIVMLVAGVAILRLVNGAASRRGGQVRFEIPSPPTRGPQSLAISLDGSQIVFAATHEDRTVLWLHSIASASARPLAGTEGGVLPFFSPDGHAVGFFSQGKLRRIDLDSGTVLPLADASTPGGGAWNGDGTILFVPIGGGAVLRIPEGGGAATAVPSTSPANNPRLLPGGRRFLFGGGPPTATGLYVSGLDGKDSQRIGDMRLAEYADTGYLLFIRDSTLFAQRFDATTAALTGTPIQLAEHVTALSVGGGSIAYRTSTAAASALVWFDRSRVEVGRAPGEGYMPSISRDGRRVTMTRVNERGAPEVWTWNLDTGIFTKFGNTPFAHNMSMWSHDDTKIFFSSDRGRGVFDLYEKSSETGGDERLVLQTDQNVFPNDRSPDGRFLLIRSSDPKEKFDLWTLSLTDHGRQPLVKTPFSEREAQFSPNGQWFAYQSDESGRDEIYIRPFPDFERARYGPVSVNGGTQVRWNPKGGELFYLAPDNRLMAVPIRAAPDGRAIDAGRPVPLFQTDAVQPGVRSQAYAVAPDGNRFLIHTSAEMVAPITILLNWKP